MATEAQQVKIPEIDPIILISSISSVRKRITIRKLKHLLLYMLTLNVWLEKYRTFITKSKNADAYQKHTPCGLMINVVNSITGSSESYLHRGHDCADVFTKNMIEVKNDIWNKMKTTNEYIKMKEADSEDFNNATHCLICGCKLKPEDKRLRNRCHFTGKCRGCAHNDCNLQFSMRLCKVPVFLHNRKN